MKTKKTIFGRKIELPTQEKKGFKVGDKIKFKDNFIEQLGFKNQNELNIFIKFSKGLDYLTVLEVSDDINPWIWFGEFYKISREGRPRKNFYNPNSFEHYTPLEIKKNVKQLKF